MKSLLLILVLPLIFAACATKKEIVEETKTLKVYNYKKKVLISGFPSKAGLEGLLKHQKVAAIVDIRSQEELKSSPYNPRDIAKKYDVNFYNVPYIRNRNISQKSVEKISGIVNLHKDSKVLVYCASGNRASSWLAVYLHQYEEASPEEAIEVAREAGLTSSKLEKMTKIHFTTRGKYNK